MEFQRFFILALILYNIDNSYSCGRKEDCHCSSIEDQSQCAKLYTKKCCGGEPIDVYGQVVNRQSTILSAEVKSGCILALYGSEGYIGSFTGVNRMIYKTVSKNALLGHIEWASIEGDHVISRNKRFTYEETLPITSATCACNLRQGCPNHKHLSPRTKEGKSLCAIIYQHGTNDPETSCFGQSKEVYNGERQLNLGDIWNDEISALVVRDGCTLTTYMDKDLVSRKTEFKGVVAKVGITNNHISSYVCRCEFPAISCTPTEGWQLIHVCNNPGKQNHKSTVMTCTHWVSHGLTVGQTTSSSYTQSQNFEATFGLELKEIFKFGFTSNTGYSWTDSTEFSTKESQETKSTVSFTVPVGVAYGLYQLWGQCGNSKIKAQYYEVRNINTAEVMENNQAIFRT